MTDIEAEAPVKLHPPFGHICQTGQNCRWQARLRQSDTTPESGQKGVAAATHLHDIIILTPNARAQAAISP